MDMEFLINMNLRSLIISLLSSTFILVPTESKSTVNEAKDQKAENSEENENKREWKPIKEKSFSKRQKREECKKYEGKYIGHYGNIYLVKKCKRHQLTDPNLTFKLFKKKTRVYPVKNDTIIMLKEGNKLNHDQISSRKTRPCSKLEGKYLVYQGNDLYLMQKCRLRKFPDWETFTEHRRKKNKRNASIVGLSFLEFKKFKKGKEFTSIMPGVFKKLMQGSEDVDLIPLDEACQGVEGRYVSYYSHLYKIEKCRKRKLNPSRFLKKSSNKNIKFKELTSEQWLSLPDGKPK